MKPVLHSISYAGLWGQDALPLEKFIPHAKALGYSSVMLTMKRPHCSPLDYDNARLDHLADCLNENGVEVACLAAYSDPNCGYTATSAPFAPIGETQLYSIRRCAEIAERLDAPVIRLMTGLASTGEPYLTQWRRCVEFMREACDIAMDHGVVIGVQNHDDIACHYLSMAKPVLTPGRPLCTATILSRLSTIWGIVSYTRRLRIM